LAKGKKKRRTQGHPARTSAAVPPRPADERPALSRQTLAIGLVVLILAGVVAFLVAGGSDDPQQEASVDPQQLAVPGSTRTA
jgi:hypothetical protein